MNTLIRLLTGIGIGTIFGLWLAGAAECVCGDVGCGGGCIDWNNAA